MTGENTTAIFHFFDNGIYIECEDFDIGKFIPKGDGNAIMDTLNDIDDLVNSEARFVITEKGKKLLENDKINRTES